ncbi:MAG: ribosome maturation factor RimM [Gammaproteobacteria bacterium]|nr:ribosome maturation factor RimM [Gammaproteobacteria bacterium]
MGQRNDKLCVGHITGVQGLKGWVKVFSSTDPRENIVHYSPWMMETGEGVKTLDVHGRLQGRLVLAKFAGVETREDAAEFIGDKIYIWPEQLPELGQDEYYWSDLIGMEVESIQAQALGRVDDMLETGADDVMVIKGDRERLIPFVIDDIVRKVDFDRRCIIVDWQPDY